MFGAARNLESTRKAHCTVSALIFFIYKGKNSKKADSMLKLERARGFKSISGYISSPDMHFGSLRRQIPEEIGNLLTFTRALQKL